MGATFYMPQFNCPYCAATFLGPAKKQFIHAHVLEHHFDKFEEFKKLGPTSYTERVLSPRGHEKLKQDAAFAAKYEQMKKDAEIMKEQPQNEIQSDAQTITQQVPEESPKTMVSIQAQQPVQPAAQVQGRAATPPQVVVVQKPVEPPGKIVMPLDVPKDPEEFLTAFFQKFELKQGFVTFQIEKFRLTRTFPHPKELLADLNDLDSGSKIRKQNELIMWFYENALKDYQQKIQVLSTPFNRIPVGFEQPPTSTTYTDRGIPIERQAPPDPYSNRQPTYQEQNELQALRAEVEKMRQEKYNELITKVHDLESKLEMAKQTPMQTSHADSYTQRIEQKLETFEQENRRLQQQVAEQASQNIVREIVSAKESFSKVPSLEQIQSIVMSTIEQEKTKLTPEDLERKVKELVDKSKTEVSPQAVQMEKLKNDFEIEKLRLDAEKSKSGQFNDLIQNVAGIFGEGIGKGLAGAGAPQPPPQTPYQVTQIQQPAQEPPSPQTVQMDAQIRPCPSCGKSVKVDPSMPIGECPHCKSPIQFTSTGELVLFDLRTAMTPQTPPQEPEPVPEQPPAPVVEKKTGDVMGKCKGCARPVYTYNLSQTDPDGGVWCKNCKGPR